MTQSRSAKRPHTTHHEHGARRGYGEARGVEKLHAGISPESKAKIVEMAQSAGISLARMVELVIEHTDVDDDGVPMFYARGEELPFDKSA